MSNNMDQQLEGRNPGIIWANSRIPNEEHLSRTSFSNWYKETHVPDVLRTGAVKEAYRYEAMDPKEEQYHLALYYAEDVDGLYDKVKGVPRNQKIFENASFDTRFYKLTQAYVNKNPSKGQPFICLSTEMTPGDVEDYERWYREEHLVDGSKVRGWRRTERYELIEALRNEDAPKFLVLFFLDCESVPVDDMQRAGSSEWTQKVVKAMKQFRSVAFEAASQHRACQL